MVTTAHIIIAITITITITFINAPSYHLKEELLTIIYIHIITCLFIVALFTHMHHVSSIEFIYFNLKFKLISNQILISGSVNILVKLEPKEKSERHNNLIRLHCTEWGCMTFRVVRCTLWTFIKGGSLIYLTKERRQKLRLQ